MAPTTPVAEVSQVALCLPEYFSQNFTKSAGKCAQPFRPIKLMPRRFWAMPISFLSRKRESRLMMSRARVGINRADAKREWSMALHRELRCGPIGRESSEPLISGVSPLTPDPTSAQGSRGRTARWLRRTAPLSPTGWLAGPPRGQLGSPGPAARLALEGGPSGRR